MSYWDTSALVKLYVQEADAAQFEALALAASVVTGPSRCMKRGRCFVGVRRRM